MNFTSERLERIYVAVSKARHARTMDRVTLGDYYKPASRITDRTLFDEITPVTTLIIMERDGSDTKPLTWCCDEAAAREALENAPHPELLSIWEVSREDTNSRDITLDVCERWLQLVDFSVDEDDFATNLPGFIEAHYSDEAMEQYRNGRAAK